LPRHPRPYLRLQWKIAAFLVLLLLSVGGSFVWHEQRLLRLQYQTLRGNEIARQVSLASESVQQALEQMQVVASTLAIRDDLRQALVLRSGNRLGPHFDDDWSLLQIQAGLALIRLYDTQGKLLREVSDRLSDGALDPREPVLQQRLQATLATERPNIYASCTESCLLYVWVPVQYHGQVIGSIMLAAPMTDVLLSINRITRAEVGIWRQRSDGEDMGGQLLAQTGGDKARRILRLAGDDWQLNADSNTQQVSWQVVESEQRHYEISRWPMRIGGNELPAQFVLLTDVEKVHAQDREALTFGVASILLGIAGALGLALSLARGFARRLALMAEAVVRLGEKQYDAVRTLLVAAHAERHWPDELDDVVATAQQVTDHLAHMESEAQEYQLRLATMFAELEHDRAFIANLLDTAPVLIVVHDGVAQVQRCNAHASVLVGVAPGGEDLPALADFGLIGVISDYSQPPAIQEASLVDTQGRLHQLVWLHRPLLLEGRERLVLSVGQDVSALKEAQAEREQLQAHLLQAQKMEAIGQLAGGIAHDFNNLLGTMLGFTGLALERFVEDKEGKLAGFLNEVLAAGHRARDIVNQLLSFSRPSVGEMTPMVLDPLVKEIGRFLQPMLPGNVRLDVAVETVPPVLANPVQIQQLLMNLVINARDAMPTEGGTIRVELRPMAVAAAICASCQSAVSGDFVALAVCDTGSGITPADLLRIFEPFFTTKEIGKGTGMGLSVVHGLIHKFGGHVEVDSHPGRGTTFRLLLPLASPSEGPA
jgi:signal transduction histidine kinase